MKKLNWLPLILGVGADLFGAPHAWALPASFNCSKARSPVEHAICNDPALGDLDGQLAAAMKLALAQAGDHRQHLLESQWQWLRNCDETCAAESGDHAASPGQKSRCLREIYEKRVTELKAQPTICDGLVARFQPIIEAGSDHVKPNAANFFEWVRILASDRKSGISLSNPLTRFSLPEAVSKEKWTNQIDRFFKPFKPDNALGEMLQELKGGYGIVDMLSLSPSENLYVLELPLGRMSCPTDTYVRVSNGIGHLANDVRVEDAGEDGGLCRKERYFGTVDGFPAMIDDEASAPSLRDTLWIRLRVAGAWTPSCAIDLDFSPRFPEAQAVLPDPEMTASERRGPIFSPGKCDGICAEIRSSALALVKKAQVDATHVEADAVSTLSPNQRMMFETMLRLKEPNITADKNVKGQALVTVPLAVNEQLYLMEIEHTAVPGYYLPERQWRVEVENLQDGSLNHVVGFTIDMTEGHLVNIGVRRLTDGGTR